MSQPSPQALPPRFSAFSYAPYRRFWLAALCRVFGLQFRFIGVGWLVVSDEGLDLSPIWLGIVGLAAALCPLRLRDDLAGSRQARLAGLALLSAGGPLLRNPRSLHLKDGQLGVQL